jgi:ribose 1,5-bisphosphokinase
MKLLVLIGPSGGGKSTLTRELSARGVIAVTPSWTTRPRRSDETGDDTDHRFVTDAEFDELHDAGYFLEVVDLFGWRYGLPAFDLPQNDKVPAISVRAVLLDLVGAHFPDNVVYQIEASLEVASERVAERGGTSTELVARLDAYAQEVAAGRQLCDRRFDTSDPSIDVVGAVLSAIGEDFQIDADVRSLSSMADGDDSARR